MKSKLLLSVATAALIVTGFTGCDAGKSEDKTISAVVNPIQQNKFTTTIKGVVLDDAGNPVKGAKVFVGNKEAITNDGGQYQIDNVDVSGYISINNGQGQVVSNANNRISVTILPPANSDMTSAVVTVTPNMIHLENKGNTLTSNAQTSAGNINTQPNSEDFTVVAEAVRAVLPHKAAKVEATIRDASTGAPVPDGTKVTAVFKGLKNTLPNETVGVSSVVGVVKNGKVELDKLLTSSKYNLVVEGYAVNNAQIEVNGQNANNIDNTLAGLNFNTDSVVNYADKDYITNLGNVLVSKINGEDTVAPYIVEDINARGIGGSVYSYLNVNLPSGRRGVVYAPGIDGSAAHPFIINFDEPLQADKINNNSVIVYDVTNKKIIPVSDVTLTNGGKTLEIVTATPVAPNTELQIRLNRASFLDLAGNIIDTANEPANVQAIANNAYLAFNASTYFKVNTTLTKAANVKEINGTSVDLTLNGYANKALSTVADITTGTIPNTLYQFNDNANANALANLASALTNNTPAVTVNNHSVRISFTPDQNVSNYYVKVVDANGNPVTGVSAYIPQANAQGQLTTQLNQPTPGVTGYINLKDAAGILHSDFVLVGNNLTSGDVVEIYPVNAFGDLGPKTTITIKDNTPLTTVLNTLGNSVDLQGANSAAGQTGDLIDLGQGATGTGLPNLFINPQMLKANAQAARTQSDLRELTGTQDNIYDAKDFANMNKSRTIGFAISEPVNKNSVITDYLKIYENNGSTVNNFVTAAKYTKLGTNNVIAFTVKNILDMQKYSKVSIAGIKDKAGNVADDMAADKIKDAMPPLVTDAKATSNGITITFDEPIKLTNRSGNGITFTLNTAPNNSRYTFTTNPNGTVTVSKSIQFTDEHGNSIAANTPITLKVVKNGSDGTLELQLPTNYTNSSGDNVDLATYFEDVHGVKNSNGNDNAVATGASELDFSNINDLLNNNWTNQRYLTGVNQLLFATSDEIAPKIAPSTQAINPQAAAADQLKLDITDGSGHLLNINQNNGDSVWEVGDTTGNYVVQIKFREPIAQPVNGQLKLFSDNADYKVVPANANNNYKILSNAKVTPTATDTIQVKFSKDSSTTGAVQAGDKLVITGIKDASGNETNVTITLNNAGQGISVNTSAYK